MYLSFVGVLLLKKDILNTVWDEAKMKKWTTFEGIKKKMQLTG